MARSARAEPTRGDCARARGHRGAARANTSPRAPRKIRQGRAADGRGGRCDRRHGAWTVRKRPLRPPTVVRRGGDSPREGFWRRDGRRVAPRTLLLVSIVERQRREKDFFVSIRTLVVTGCHTENEGLFSGFPADSDNRVREPKKAQKGGTEFKIAGNIEGIIALLTFSAGCDCDWQVSPLSQSFGAPGRHLKVRCRSVPTALRCESIPSSRLEGESRPRAAARSGPASGPHRAVAVIAPIETGRSTGARS